jgi:hypothetical protein
MINSSCMGDYVNLKPCVWVYNSFGISIVINFSVWVFMSTSIIVHYNVMGGILILKQSQGFYNYLNIPIMTNFGVMGGCLYIKPTLRFYNSINISIMTHSSHMGGC